MRLKKNFRWSGIILILVLLLSLFRTTEVRADESWPTGPEIISVTGVLMDMETGTILYDKDMDKQMYPASITKIMTTLLALENGNLSDVVTMTQTGVSYAVSGSSNLYTVVGEQFTLEQLLYGTMLKSANDMATQVGEYIGGTIENFVQMMNDRAAELGCTGTHFNNACGMPDPDHYTTAHDMALICQAALKLPEFLEIIGTHTYTIPPTNMTDTERIFASHVPLLVNEEYAYPGILGGKTGYTDAAQNTFCSFVSQNGVTLIAVTMSAGDILLSAQDHIDLFNFGYSSFDSIQGMTSDRLLSGGKAMVPTGVTADALTVTQTGTNADGTESYTMTYGGRTVGTALFAAVTPEPTAAADPVNAASGGSGNLLGLILKILLIAAIIILVILIVMFVRASMLRKKREEELRRRRAARRRREAEMTPEESVRRKEARRKRLEEMTPEERERWREARRKRLEEMTPEERERRRAARQRRLAEMKSEKNE